MPGINVVPRVVQTQAPKNEETKVVPKVRMVIRGYKNTNLFPISVRSGNKSFGLESGAVLKNKHGQVVTSAGFMPFVGPGSLSVMREALKEGEEMPKDVKMENEDAPLKNPYHGAPVGARGEPLPNVVRPTSKG